MHPDSRVRRRLSMVFATTVLLVAATSASAVTRYASPGGTGSAPCAQANPCNLTQAVTAAVANDEVRVLPGTHTVPSTLGFAEPDVLVQGEPGSPKPTISYTGPANAHGVQLFGTAVNVRFADVTIAGTTDGGSYLVAISTGGSAVFDRVTVRNGGSGAALVGTVDVRNSVVASATAGGAAAEVVGTVVGSTIVADADPGSRAIDVDVANFFPGASRSLTVTNSIVRGGDRDITLQGELLAGITLNIDYSAYGGPTKIGVGPFATVNEGTHNVVAAPLLVGLAGGADVHQLAGSPTIDAGNPAAVGSSTGDVDGQARVIGSAPDIGADEFTPAPAVNPGPATAIAVTAATLNGTVNPNGLATTYHFEYGPTAAYGSSTPTAAVAAGVAPVAVAAALTGLTPNTTYHARLVATNSQGATNGTDVVFTTLAAADPPPVVGPLTFVALKKPLGYRVVRFSLSEQAKVTVIVDRLVPGRTVGGTCRPAATAGPRCTKVVRVRTIVRVKSAGAATQVVLPASAFTGVGSRTYRITVRATDLLTGRVSNTRRAIQRVVVLS